MEFADLQALLLLGDLKHPDPCWEGKLSSTRGTQELLEWLVINSSSKGHRDLLTPPD